MPRNNPSSTMPIAFRTDPLASTTAATSPKTISEKYSTEVKVLTKSAM